MRTHCKRGHLLSPDNVWIGKRGARTCRICSREKYRAWVQRRSEQVGGRCPDCGKPTSLTRDRKASRRCRQCAAKLKGLKLRGPQHTSWVGDAARPQTGRKRAATRYEATVCEKCGSTKHVERHHRDGNTTNNEPGNVAILCRRCHMEADGRLQGMPGEANPGSKLTWAQVVEMRRLHAMGVHSQKQLAERFGVSPATVHRVIRGQAWRRNREEADSDGMAHLAMVRPQEAA